MTTNSQPANLFQYRALARKAHVSICSCLSRMALIQIPFCLLTLVLAAPCVTNGQTGSSAAVQDKTVKQADAIPSAQEVEANREHAAKLLRTLNSPQFAVRHRSTLELVKLGGTAVEAIEQQIDQLAPDARRRCLEVLSSISQANDSTARTKSFQAIQALSTSDNRQLAEDALKLLNKIRLTTEQLAVETMTELGAEFQFQNSVVNGAIFQVPVALLVGPNWTGRSSDLESLSMLLNLQSVTFDHPSINDADMEYLVPIPLLRVVSIKRSPKITNAAIEPLSKIKFLNELEVFDCALNENCVPTIYKCEALSAVRLYGTQISPDLTETMEQQMAASIAIKRGGFLGIRYQVNSGVLTEVVEGASAQRAGMQIGDVIIEADGQPIVETTDIAKVLREKRAGASVEMKVNRSGVTVSMTVELDSWK